MYLIIKNLINFIHFNFTTHWVLKFFSSFRKDSFFVPITNTSKKIIILFSKIFFVAMILYIIANFNTVICVEPLTNFFERQHNLRVAIITDLITNTSKLDDLVAINKIVKTKVALLWDPILCTDSSNLTPLSPDSKINPHPIKSFFFWILMIIVCLIFDGLITFGTFLFSDAAALQETTLNNFLRISSNYELVNDLYNMLIKTEIIVDSD